jgi:phosphopantetheinyl transferase
MKIIEIPDPAPQPDLPPAIWDLAAGYGNELSRKEFLLSRHYLRLFLGEEDFKMLQKDNMGRWRCNAGNYVSLSHSYPFLAFVRADRPVGVDIQRILAKISLIAPKFIPQEALAAAQADVFLATLHWAIREAIFKAYALGGLDFRRHILLPDNAVLLSGAGFWAYVQKGEEAQRLAYWITWASERGTWVAAQALAQHLD